MKKRRNFLITENSDEDIININHIVYIAKYSTGSKLFTSDGRTCTVSEKPNKVLDMVVGRKKHD